MAKKGLLALILAALFSTGVSAQSLWSLGGGVLFDGGGIGSYERQRMLWHGPGDMRSTTDDVSLRSFRGGVWGFADARFVELSVGFLYGWESLHIEGEDVSFRESASLDVSLLGKIPFFLGRADIFPLLGIGYSSNFRFKVGAGADIDIWHRLFLRASVLGSYRLAGDRFDRGGFGITVKAGVGRRM